MSPEVGPVCESSVAVGAGERLLSSVRPDVSLEQPRSGESFPAYFANTGQGVSPDVHFESSKAHVFLLAVFATEGFPRLGVAVQLFVLEQSRVRGVGLAAQTTLEFLSLHPVRVCQLGQHLLVLITPRAFRAAVVFGGGVGERRGVSGDGGEVAGERRQRQVAGSPHRDGAVRRRAQDLRLGDDGQGEAPVDVRREEHCWALQLTVIWLLCGVYVFLDQKRAWHLGRQVDKFCSLANFVFSFLLDKASVECVKTEILIA